MLISRDGVEAGSGEFEEKSYLGEERGFQRGTEGIIP
jgi:hypothetical protein